ncbi:ribosome maturation factor RimP [Spirulina major]|uniref:ribosome maturation factor RimP n=1 Tax=Spirulina major TaxID=270636 RepID=UPI0009342E33|nr:ribosome maturation factor RimP [Spirulina major]
MAHPLIPQLLELAAPIAEQLGLEVVGAVFQTSKSPPVLRIDIRNLTGDTGLNDCEQMSRLFEAQLDATDLIPGAYVLELSSPGVSRQLTTDREFTAFQGFAVVVKTYAPYDGKKQWPGRLQRRDSEHLYLSQKGKTIAIPRQAIATVQLDDHADAI